MPCDRDSRTAGQLTHPLIEHRGQAFLEGAFVVVDFDAVAVFAGVRVEVGERE